MYFDLRRQKNDDRHEKKLIRQLEIFALIFFILDYRKKLFFFNKDLERKFHVYFVSKTSHKHYRSNSKNIQKLLNEL